jgi:hypothetical protein
MQKILLIILLNVAIGLNLFSQYQMRTIQVYSDIAGNATIQGNTINTQVPAYAFGINVNSGYEYINLVLEYDYHMVNIESLPEPATQKIKFHELYAGLRFFPMKPTFMLGNFSIRPTFGGNVGFDMNPEYRGMLYAGLHFSTIRNVSGISFQFVYRTGTHNVEGYIMPPFWGVRCAVVFGPAAE